MASIISALIIILIIFELSIFSSWIDKFGRKHQEEFIEKVVEKASDKLAMAWYLVVYTKENSHPIWISNNKIRSVHPDVKNCRLIIKLFNGEDMVIDDVENYDLQAGNEMLGYDFQ
nr:MAG TPA: hypothetical protein [Bacteriophage sp.]